MQQHPVHDVGQRLGLDHQLAGGGLLPAAARHGQHGIGQTVQLRGLRDHEAKGGVLAAEAVDHTRQKAVSWPHRQWNTRGKGGVLAAQAVEHTRQKAVSWPQRQWTTRGKGGVLGAEAVTTRGRIRRFTHLQADSCALRRRRLAAGTGRPPPAGRGAGRRRRRPVPLRRRPAALGLAVAVGQTVTMLTPSLHPY